MNYRLCLALQMMGCGNTDGGTLAGFLDLPVPWDTVNDCIKSVESVMGPLQIEKRKESEAAAVIAEIKAHEENNDLEYHECNDEEHGHGPLPMLKGSYG